jgi:hypothetical protein
LIFIVLVVTTGVGTVEGAIQAGIGFFVTEQILTYLPARVGGGSLVIVLFAFGSLQYAKHPEGILEYQKRRSNQRFEKRFFPEEYYAMHPSEAPATDGAPAGVASAEVVPEAHG